MPFNEGSLNSEESGALENEKNDLTYDLWESLSDEQRQWVEDKGQTMEGAFKDASTRIAQAQMNIKLLESDPFFAKGFPSKQSWSEQSRWPSKDEDFKFYK